jgi:hypothetical protein
MKKATPPHETDDLVLGDPDALRSIAKLDQIIADIEAGTVQREALLVQQQARWSELLTPRKRRGAASTDGYFSSVLVFCPRNNFA